MDSPYFISRDLYCLVIPMVSHACIELEVRIPRQLLARTPYKQSHSSVLYSEGMSKNSISPKSSCTKTLNGNLDLLPAGHSDGHTRELLNRDSL